MKKKKIITGITDLDDLLGGGVTTKTGLLLVGAHGAGKTMLLAGFLHHGITKMEENGVFVSFEHCPESIMNDLSYLGLKVETDVAQKKLTFVDASPSPDCEEIGSCYSMTPLVARIKLAVTQNGAKRVSLDGLSYLFQKFDDKKMIYKSIIVIATELKKLGVTYIFSSEQMPELAYFSGSPDIFQTVVELKSKAETKYQNKPELRLVKQDGILVGSGG